MISSLIILLFLFTSNFLFHHHLSSDLIIICFFRLIWSALIQAFRLFISFPSDPSILHDFKLFDQPSRIRFSLPNPYLTIMGSKTYPFASSRFTIFALLPIKCLLRSLPTTHWLSSPSDSSSLLYFVLPRSSPYTSGQTLHLGQILLFT
jgi:hypothetical protein